MKNYYEILEISQNASPEVIEKAYKALAKKYHPDTQPKDKLFWAELKMKEINEAYRTLSNDNSKYQYDEKLRLDSSDFYRKYAELRQENEELKNQAYNSSYQDTSSSTEQPVQSRGRTKFGAPVRNMVSSLGNSDLKSVPQYFKGMFAADSQDEKKNRLLAIILTIVIMSILVLLFWKVPFLNKILS